MSLELKIIDPITDERWDKQLIPPADYSIFHSSAWASVLSKSYRYRPLYLILSDKNNIAARIPFMEINSFITGRRGVSLPFSDYCDPILDNEIPIENILDRLIDFGRNFGWKYLELRCSKRLIHNQEPSTFFYGHTLDLSRKEEQLLSGCRDSTKRNIRKAKKTGVTVIIDNSYKAMCEYYRLHSITRRRQGVPPQPFHFFKNIHNNLISKNRGLIVLASYNKDIIAGNIYLHFHRKAYYKFGAADMNSQHLRPSNIVMWEAIKWYAKHGYKSLCFGRTSPDNKGLLQYKKGWGTNQKVINYYKYDFNLNSFVKDDSQENYFSTMIFKRLPIPILKLAGNILYKHVG
jgi:hypothetical protein